MFIWAEDWQVISDNRHQLPEPERMDVRNNGARSTPMWLNPGLHRVLEEGWGRGCSGKGLHRQQAHDAQVARPFPRPRPGKPAAPQFGDALAY
jgi:hypothetical protein